MLASVCPDGKHALILATGSQIEPARPDGLFRVKGRFGRCPQGFRMPRTYLHEAHLCAQTAGDACRFLLLPSEEELQVRSWFKTPSVTTSATLHLTIPATAGTPLGGLSREALIIPYPVAPVHSALGLHLRIASSK